MGQDSDNILIIAKNCDLLDVFVASEVYKNNGPNFVLCYFHWPFAVNSFFNPHLNTK